MLQALAFITTKPNMRDAVLDAFRAYIPSVHAEDGCIDYGPMIGFLEVGPFQAQLGSDT